MSQNPLAGIEVMESNATSVLELGAMASESPGGD